MTVMCPICLEWHEVDDEIFFSDLECDCNEEYICTNCEDKYWKILENIIQRN